MALRFISDLHLEAGRPDVARTFVDLLEESAADEAVSSLYILGDLFEMWIGDDDDDPFNRGIVHALRRASAHLPISVMHGNRDFLLGAGFAQASGARVLTEAAVLECAGRRLLVSHGDELCTDDVAYQQLRGMLRSPTWQQGVLARPLAERRALGRAMRGESQAQTGRLDPGIMDVAPPAVDAFMQRHQVDLLIHGHTHRPGIHRHTHGRRYVLGDWDRLAWLLDISADGARLTSRPLAHGT